MKKLKKILFLVLLCCLVCALIACVNETGNDDKDDGGGTTDGGTTNGGGTADGNDDNSTLFDCLAGNHNYTVENKCSNCNKAWEYTEGLEFKLSRDGQSYFVVGIGTVTDTEVIIPYGYDDKPINRIGERAFRNCNRLIRVTIPDSVTIIEREVFWNCENLTSVTIPTSVTSIGKSAFSGCTGLTSITIPTSVTSIGESAFYNCNNLTSVYITDITKWCNIYFDDAKSNPLVYAENLYLNGKLVTELVIPDSVTSIGSWAFYNCNNLTSVTIPDSVTSIGSRAFYNCNNLTSVTIPDSVTNIGNYTFYGTGYYNNNANWENGVLYIGKYLIEVQETISEDYIIKDGTLCVAASAFYNCDSLTSITIPNSVTSIGNWAFYNCTFTIMTIPDSVTSIGNHAFYSCDTLTSVTIGNGVTSIWDSAFEDCTSLTSVTIPDSVTSIGRYTFSGCNNITSIKYSGTEEQWTAITKGYHWEPDTNYSITYNYTGE